MASFNLEVKYYNTFWLKHVTTKLNGSSNPTATGIKQEFHAVFPGLPYKGYSGTTDNQIEYDESINFVGNSTTKPISNVNRGSNIFDGSDKGSNFVIEESRIRGAFNNQPADLGVRAFLREEENKAKYRSNALVFSGVYNSRTSFNETNVFSIGQDITRSVDPSYGSIQLIDSMDNDLTIFQENKVNRALVDKDAIYTAEGQALTTAGKNVIGQITPYVGDYGISKNPESFAKYGFRRYFSDKYRNSILRLSRDGITEISEYGMKDFFRDELNKVSDGFKSVTSPAITAVVQFPPDSLSSNSYALNTLGAWVVTSTALTDDELPEVGSIVEYYNTSTNTWVTTNAVVTGENRANKLLFLSEAGFENFIDSGDENPSGQLRFISQTTEKVVGGYDAYQDQYVVSLQRRSGSKTDDETSDYYNTLHYDEKVRGWVSFYSYRPEVAFSMKSRYFSTKDGKLYEHYEGGFLGDNVFQSITPCDMGTFYGTFTKSNVIFVFNQNPNRVKTFTTIDYEGSNGWQVDWIRTDDKSKLQASTNGDESKVILSYNEGEYTDGGITYYSGFNQRENKYYANIINNSPQRPGEVVFGNQMTGVKGFVAKVSMSTDTLNTGDLKELFSVGSNVI